MFKKVTYSVISFSVLATSLGIVNAHAKESNNQSTSEKEQWGMATNNT